MRPTNLRKGPKTEGEKTEDVYKRLIKQQKEQIALQGRILSWRRLNIRSARANFLL
jgi:hypothetical protein